MAQLSYEEARDELTKESLKLWERGEELAAICQQWLDGARAKLEAAKSEAEAE
jgi:exodeoxyribonuclease VII small subunit